MTEKIEVPDEVLGAFNRIMNKVPREVRNDREVQRSIITFLKVGGLRLASHYINYKKLPFAAEFDLVKKRPVEEPAQSAETAASKTQTDPSKEEAQSDDPQASPAAETSESGDDAEEGKPTEARSNNPTASTG